jgi:hypothetical protein
MNTCGGGGDANACGCPTLKTCKGEGADCGAIDDGCGAEINCGKCMSPDACNGGGVYNQCAAHPPLLGVDAYILKVEENYYRATFATDGVASSGGYCCSTTVQGVRDSYPTKNMAYLPKAGSNITAGEIPPLNGVDGYVVHVENSTGFRIMFATDGATSGGGYCCPKSIPAAIAAYPTKNLVVLPKF